MTGRLQDMEQRPADSIYALIGRFVVRFIVNRYRTQIVAAGAVGVLTVAIGAWLALSRGDPDDG